MADNERQSNHDTPAGQDDSVSFAAIFGAESPGEGDDLIVSATDETIALLNSVFAGDHYAWESSVLWNVLSFG